MCIWEWQGKNNGTMEGERTGGGDSDTKREMNAN